MDQTQIDDFKRYANALIRRHKDDHPEEAADIEKSPPQLYGTPEEGLLKIGNTIYVVRDRKVVSRFGSPVHPNDWTPG